MKLLTVHFTLEFTNTDLKKSVSGLCYLLLLLSCPLLHEGNILSGFAFLDCPREVRDRTVNRGLLVSHNTWSPVMVSCFVDECSCMYGSVSIRSLLAALLLLPFLWSFFPRFSNTLYPVKVFAP